MFKTTLINSFSPCILKTHNSFAETSFKEIAADRSCLSKLYLILFIYSFADKIYVIYIACSKKHTSYIIVGFSDGWFSFLDLAT